MVRFRMARPTLHWNPRMLKVRPGLVPLKHLQRDRILHNITTYYNQWKVVRSTRDLELGASRPSADFLWGDLASFWAPATHAVTCHGPVPLRRRRRGAVVGEDLPGAGPGIHSAGAAGGSSRAGVINDSPTAGPWATWRYWDDRPGQHTMFCTL